MTLPLILLELNRPPVLDRRTGGRVNHHPTPAQQKAGNYAKRHDNIAGLDISVENEKGSTRRGIGPDGKPWRSVLPAAYGYFKKSTGADGDHVDVYIGPHRTSPKVFVIDQHNAEDKSFDEHKIMLGFGSKAQAERIYKQGFSDGKGADRLGAIHEMSVAEFKDWLKSPATKHPVRKITREAFDYHDGKASNPERCNNCRYTSGSDNGCGLYRMINQRMPDDFDLDPAIAPNAWCNGWQPRRDEL